MGKLPSQKFSLGPSFSENVINLHTIQSKEIIIQQTKNWTPFMWHAARFTVQAHGIAPLLFYHFANLQALDDIEQNLRWYLADQYALNKSRIAKVQDTLQSLFQKADHHNLALMPLKGSILINKYYPDPALRPMADIDILVHPENIEQFSALLKPMGYQQIQNNEQIVFTDTNSLVSLDGEHPDNPVKIELHDAVGWPIGYQQFDLTRSLWIDAEAGFMGHDSIISPNQVRFLLMLICHNAGNQFNGKMRAFQLHDLALVSKQMDGNSWRDLHKIIQDNYLDRIAYSVLTIAKRFSDIEIPTGFVEELKQLTPRPLQRQMKSQNLDSLIAANDYKLLGLKIQQGRGKKFDSRLKIYQLLTIAILKSMQLNWFNGINQVYQQIRHVFSLSNYRKNEQGSLVVYVVYYWLLLPVLMFPFLIFGGEFRVRLLSEIRRKMLCFLDESYNGVG